MGACPSGQHCCDYDDYYSKDVVNKNYFPKSIVTKDYVTKSLCDEQKQTISENCNKIDAVQKAKMAKDAETNCTTKMADLLKIKNASIKGQTEAEEKYKKLEEQFKLFRAFECSPNGLDLAPGQWVGGGRTSLDQCKERANTAGVKYFAWTPLAYNGYCKVLKKGISKPNLKTNQGYGYRLYERK